MPLILGLILIVAGIFIALFRDLVIRHWTSRFLGSLAPGYAANRTGVLVYAALVANLGAILLAIEFENAWLLFGLIALFIIGSIVVVVGEAVTYRRLKRS